jgi:hypothetical protein
MADSKKYCTECFLPAPPDWNQRYCPNCGGRIKLKLVKKRNASQGRSRMPEEEEPRKERKPRTIKLSRKLAKPDTHSIFSAREKSVLGPRFLVMSPVLLFILNILSLGLRSTLWVVNRKPSLLMMAKTEEKNIKSVSSLWMTLFITHFALSAIIIFRIVSYGPDIQYLTGSYLVRAAAAAFALSFIMNRFMLYWSREVIIDELLQNELDVIRSRAITFAPSPLMIWFVGIPYIQYHINRMIKKKGLNAYTPSSGIRVRKPSRMEAGNKRKPELAPGPADVTLS